MTKGQRIKQLREKAGLTQEELAKKLNTTKQTVHKYEKNIVTNIPSDKIEALAFVLDSTPEYILGWETPPEDQARFDAMILKNKDLMDMIKKYLALDDKNKKAVKQMIDNLSE